MSEARGGAPRTAVVVGAGMVGLSTAWFLQEQGVEVTVVDRRDVAAGASWGNAGWISPGLSIPLPEPSVLRYGLRSLLDRNAPLYVPVRVDVGLWSFLLRFAAHCTMRAWRRSMRGFLPVNAQCLDAYDQLAENGISVPTVEAPITAAFEKRAQAADLLRELALIRDSGQDIGFAELTGQEVRERMPQVSERVELAIRLDGQRYVDPGAYTNALGEAVEKRGGTVRGGFTVADVRPEGGGIAVRSTEGESVRGDAVVLAAGSWMTGLARRLGVRTRVQAGRGYSFTVPTEQPVPGPLYLPAVRVACTPYQGGLRVAGTMEFRGPDDPLDQGRIRAIVSSARPLMEGIAWEERTDEWVGPRPVTPDGLPLVGATKAPGVYVAGGHGMWGLTLGPITGRLLAEQITTGRRPRELAAFDPLR
ncbi:NAD(P)/FAD-dependent oxidoreductase [Thermobifida cellulosilytica]|uniref:Amino acid dehydrogenase n=1 Tax=Thermobifida cellulosilytica TB100 TaxID=665004 RepID=A0A147KI85_THECS|nr:FAD-dependent oxidoreductase [Thermobifida cellulosilytica]KUP97007.1 amino acid dehydrogenase [Thermobifida cellulosilytica TB100]